MNPIPVSRLLRVAARSLVLAAAAFGAEPVVASDVNLSVRVPADAPLPWRGIVPHEGAGVAGAILYPAPTLVGFLAAVLVHGLLVEGGRAGQRSLAQTGADKVLDPHRAALDPWTPRLLIEAALPLLTNTGARDVVGPNDKPSTEWVVDVAPGFALAQDQATIVLDTVVRVAPAADAPGPRFEGALRVLSTPVAAADRQAHWLADEGRALKEETARMLAHAINLGVAQLSAPVPAKPEEVPFRTHRYLMGDEERMERGQLLAAGCARIVVRTLRGGLMSMPVRAEAAPSCTTPYKTSPLQAAPAS